MKDCRKINILHIIEDLEIGGAETRLINDLRYLNRGRFSNVVCALRQDIQMDTCSLEAPVFCFNVNSISGILKNLSKINSIVKEYNIDIIHTQLFWADLIGRALKFLNRNKILLSTIQSSANEKNNKDLYSEKHRFIDSFTGRLLNDGFIAVSEHVKNISLKNAGFSADKMRVIYNSVDVDYASSESKIRQIRKEFGFFPGQKTMVNIGRLVPSKGHISLIDSIREIKKKIPRIKMIVIGDGPDKDKLINYAGKIHVAENIIFAGKRIDARDVLSACDIFVFPVLYGEGLSVALLEAMAASLPCIATSIPANAEVITHGLNGLLVGCAKPEEIATAVIHLFENRQESQRLGIEANSSVKQRFSARVISSALEEYYNSLIFKGAQ